MQAATIRPLADSPIESARRETMKAMVRDRYGPPAEILRLEEVEKASLDPEAVLVRVRAASVNPADWYTLSGPLMVRVLSKNGFLKPKQRCAGADFAGVVEAVGERFDGGVQPGDEVFGVRTGAMAEYITVKKAVVKKPPGVSFEEAAALPIAGLTALQALRDKGGLEAGQKVLVNGASGGVGTYTVQLAKVLGAEVTAVCSTRNVELARSLGADRVIDYTREDFTRTGERYDLVVDIAGSRTFSKVQRVLKPEAVVVVVGAKMKASAFGPLPHVVRFKLASLARRRKATFFVSKLNRPDLEYLAELLATGRIRSVIDRTYELTEAAQAYSYLGEGHARGKIVVRV